MLVGRDSELAALRDVLSGGGLVTITGTGGVGKTALALAAAPDAPVCELGVLALPDEVAPAAARALGYPSLDAAVVGGVNFDGAGTQRVLVLDNCEHVLDEAAATAHRLVARCPGLTVLATSREPLDIPGERLFPLAPLALPAGDRADEVGEAPAVRLLLLRARNAGADLELDDASAPAVAELCRRLDGLPLAIELAAARTRTLTPAEILPHLERGPELLTRARARGPARHRSLDDAIAWSHGRLPPAARRFFERLAVFSGRFTAESAQAVAGEPGEDLLRTVGHLDQLVTQSLLTVQRRSGRSWYGLLFTVRAFATGRLAERGELDAVADRWVEALTVLADDTWNGFAGSTALDDAWSTIHAAQLDLRAAVLRCLEIDDGIGRAATLLLPLWPTVHSGRAEPIAELGEAMLVRWPDRTAPGWSTSAAVTAFAQLALHDLDRATDLARATLEAAVEPFAALLACRTLTVCELTRGHPEQALRWADDALAAASSPVWTSEVATLRAVVLAALGREDEAGAQIRAAHDAAVRVGSATLQAWAGLTRACLLALQDRPGARSDLETLVHRCRDIGYPLGAAAGCRALGAIALMDGDHRAAADRLGEALDAFVRIGHEPHLRVTLRWIAALLAAAGRPEPAAILRRVAGVVRTPTAEILERAWLDARVGDDAADGSTLPLAEAVALARRELAEPAAEPVVGGTDRFALEGSVWTVTYAHHTVRLPDSKGMRDLATLLARAGREIHCTELLGAAVEQSDTGELLDEQARRRYEARIVELQAQLSEAEETNDRGRAEAASLELDLLVEQLAAATGLGGRARRSGGTTERARTAVTWRIRAAIKRIAEAHPDAGAHLRDAVRTGTWCSYQPPQPVGWQLSAPAVAQGR